MFFSLASLLPQGLKLTFFWALSDTAEQVAEKVVEGAKGIPQVLKR